MVNKAVEQMVCASHGESVWEAIKARANVDVDVFISNESYDDDVTYRLVGAACEVLGLPAETVLKAFGRYWVLETAQKGYGALMHTSGRNLGEFLVNLDNMHTRVRLMFPKLNPPHFECHDLTASSLQLRYFSHRPGLAPFVVGLVEGLGEMFRTPAKVEQVGWKNAGVEYDAFSVQWTVTPGPA